MLLNLHGSGMFLCIVGGIFSLLSYRLFCYLGVSDLTAFFLAAAALSVYSEIMARVRKYPATSYLLVALFPLVPGADIYYTCLLYTSDFQAQLHSCGNQHPGHCDFCGVLHPDRCDIWSSACS